MTRKFLTPACRQAGRSSCLLCWKTFLKALEEAFTVPASSNSFGKPACIEIFSSEKIYMISYAVKKVLLVCFTAVCCFSYPLTISAMTVEEAYQAIPHARTVFDLDSAKMLSDEKEYLVKVFTLTDRALVVRVQSLQWFQSNRQIKLDNEKYDGVLTELKSLHVPKRLEEFHSLIVSAVESQKLFFDTWSKRNWFNYDFVGDEQVKSSSADLKQAYNVLMSLYPIESAQNKQAFFDYLCALDFL